MIYHINLPLFGKNFTYYQSNGRTTSRLDKILMYDGYWELGEASQWILPKDVSDHYPTILKYFNQLWSLIPFRFNNHWIAHGDFDEMVHVSKSESLFSGLKAFVLKEKLKSLKGVLKV